MPNRFLFGVAFDRPDSRGEAFCLQNKQSPSLRRMSSAKLQVRQDYVHIEWNPNSGALSQKKGGTSLASKEELKRVENEHSRAVISPDG